ncbi:MAG: GNAT family N-acetyltransferase [Bacteroidetes bacterium]|nr:GNAT family N-acetyltransferase [Bacteroidota bacterium]
MLEQASEISKVTINEVELLRNISVQTFTETFAHQNSESDMRKYVSENLSIEQLSKELNIKGSSFYFLNLNSDVIGYLKINTGKAQTELKNDISLEIERIYIKHEFHGKNIGKQLLDKAIEIAKEHHYQYIWLAVWELNLKAIAFYKKHNFVEFDKHIFKLGDDEQIDIMMKMNLN